MDNVHCFNPWDPQSKRQYDIDGHYCTLNAGQACGGQAHGVCYAIQGNVVDRNSTQNGCGICENVSPVLNTQDRHSVCYAVDCRNNYVIKEKTGTLQAHNDGGYSLNCTHPVLYERK